MRACVCRLNEMRKVYLYVGLVNFANNTHCHCAHVRIFSDFSFSWCDFYKKCSDTYIDTWSHGSRTGLMLCKEG